MSEVNTTPDVTDEDRRAAIDFSREVVANPDSFLPDLVTRSRVILAHVPAPPATLADELRGIPHVYDLPGPVINALFTLADRVEAVEKDATYWENTTKAHEAANARWIKRTETAEQDRDDYEHLYATAIVERDEARAEVERLTSERTVQESLPVALPDPADVRDGEAWSVVVDGEHRVGIRCESAEDYETPWGTSPSAENEWWVGDDDITLVSRLVPDVRRVIDRPEDLDALPFHSVVIDGHGVAKQKGEDTKWDGWFESDIILERGPATLVYEPGVVTDGDSTD